MDASRIARELQWKPSVTFEKGLRATVAWYVSHRSWLEHVMSGEYMEYYGKNYGAR
jgi:dTDP-glucose 4,6-dehydratase